MASTVSISLGSHINPLSVQIPRFKAPKIPATKTPELPSAPKIPDSWDQDLSLPEIEVPSTPSTPKLPQNPLEQLELNNPTGQSSQPLPPTKF